MKSDQTHIALCLEKIEQKIDWGKSEDWSHLDFLKLSERIQEETGDSLSYNTLKRIWGKVSYDSHPNVNTLNTLARFLGHPTWRDFVSASAGTEKEHWFAKRRRMFNIRNAEAMGLGFVFCVAIVLLLLIGPGASDRPSLNPDDFSFSSEKVVSQGIPNSVVFEIDASASPFDSVEVQQSWDTRLRTKISRRQTQHTSIYYYPGFFQAKLVVGGEIVREHDLHITTPGWYCAIQLSPVPVYFQPSEFIHHERMELLADHLLEKNVQLQPTLPIVRYGISSHFDDLKTDNFVFEARVRNTYGDGSGVCKHSRIYLLCEGSAIWIPLMEKGCASAASMNFLDYYFSGKEHDLSAFGVDFQDAVHVRIQSIDAKAAVFLNGTHVFSVEKEIPAVVIKAIDFRFEGPGMVDDVKLGRPDGGWVLFEDFDGSE